VKMIAINSGDTTMAVAHIFAEANVGDRDQFRTFRFDCSERFLNHSVFCVSAAGLLILVLRNSEEQDCLQPQVVSAARFIGNLFQWQLKSAWHTGDRPALVQFFADEQRQDKIVNGQMRFTDQVPQGRGTPQATRPMDQSSHRARLPARRVCRKPTMLPSARRMLDGAERWVSAS
jgi:hypothetical protein